MANVNGSWVVAGKKSKGSPASPSSKGKKKPFTDGMPRIEPSLPVEESPTIYSVFMQEEEKKERRLLEREQQQQAASSKSSSSAVGPSASKKGSQAPKKAAATDKKKEKALTLEEVLKEVEIAELQKVLTKDKATFPDNPDVWLKDLVSLLNLKLDKLPVPDPTFADKPAEYPASLLSKQLRDFLVDTLSKMSPQTLHLFLDHCIDSMMNDIIKGIPTYGFHIYIQLLLSLKPQIGIASLPTYLAQLKDNLNRPQRALCILWSLGQAGLKDLASGLKVWLELMLPILNMRTLSSFAVQYLETLFRRHQKSIESTDAALPKREFFRLLDELFSPQPAITVELRRRLMKLYPQLKMVAFGNRPDLTLHNFFPSFLSRCTADCNLTKKTELLSCLDVCLLVDKQSFSVWRQIYVKNLAQSSILMRHLTENLDGSVSQIDRRLLRETVRAFHVTNEDLGSNCTSGQAADVQLCAATCQYLLNRLSQVRVPSHWFIVLLVVVFAALLALGVDVYTSGGIYECRTYRLLDGLGVIAFIYQAWQRLSLYSSKAWFWLAETVPVYWAKVVSIVLPYTTLVYQRLLHLCRILSELIQPAILLCSDYLTQLVTWLDSKLPWLLEVLSVYTTTVFNFISRAYELSAYYVAFCAHWITSNILVGSWSPDNILKTLSTVLITLKSYVVTFYQWLISLFA